MFWWVVPTESNKYNSETITAVRFTLHLRGSYAGCCKIAITGGFIWSFMSKKMWKAREMFSLKFLHFGNARQYAVTQNKVQPIYNCEFRCALRCNQFYSLYKYSYIPSCRSQFIPRRGLFWTWTRSLPHLPQIPYCRFVYAQTVRPSLEIPPRCYSALSERMERVLKCFVCTLMQNGIMREQILDSALTFPEDR